VLILPDELAASVLSAAGRAYPSECCGLIEGVDGKDGWQALGIHEAANVADDPSRHFLIDPQVQFDLLRSLRGSGRRIIGCFHSHPDGVPEPSATDRANAYESDFLYLIAGGSPDAGFTLRAYRFLDEAGFSAIELCGES
jgi:proteasome lid subunit RPN8/RPN11